MRVIEDEVTTVKKKKKQTSDENRRKLILFQNQTAVVCLHFLMEITMLNIIVRLHIIQVL